MLRLPRICAGAAEIRLPLFVHTAIEIANCLLGQSVGKAVGDFLPQWQRLLQSDPALTLWALIRGGVPVSGDWQSLADWLNHHLVQVLQWDPNELCDTPPLPCSGELLAHESRAISAWEQARIAWQDHSGESTPPSSIAALCEVVGSEWIAAASQPADGWRQIVPEWIIPLHGVRAPQGPPGGDNEASNRTATGYIDAFSTEFDLPHWIAAWARSRDLEQRFSQQLEQAKLDAVRQLAYGASHEINNPLANISTRAQALLRDERDPERRRKLATIHHQAMRAHEMISDMMLFANPPQPRRLAVNIEDLLDQSATELRSQAQLQGTEIRRTARQCDTPCEIDAEQIQLCVRSLALNSLEALGQSGFIEIGASEWNDEDRPVPQRIVEITVRDSGPGMSLETRRHACDPFYSGREAGRGLGFGLAKCWRIMQLHGGQLELDSQEGVGTSTRLRFSFQGSPGP